MIDLNIKKNILLYVLVVKSLFSIGFSQKLNRKVLNPPDSFIDTWTTTVQSIMVEENNIHLMSFGSSDLIKQNLNYHFSHKPNQELRKRITLEKLKNQSLNIILNVDETGFVILDGTESKVYRYSKDGALISSQSLVYDKLLPPLDQGGEAPNYEQAELQKLFSENYKKINDKFSGSAKVPSNLIKSDSLLYFIASRVENFPILVLSCMKDNPVQCSIKRACYVEGNEIKNQNIFGIGYVPSSRKIILGDQNKNRIEIYSYNTCLNIEKIGEYFLPPKIKKITNIFIDDQENMWITTKTQDDYSNANLMKWNVSHLQKIIN